MTVRRPFKIDGTTGLKQMSDGELDYVSYVTRVAYAALTDGPGHLTINSAPAGYSSIGSVTDESRSVGRSSSNIGDVHGVDPTNSNVAAPGTLSSVVYTVSQNYNNSNDVPSSTNWNLGPLVAVDASFNNVQPLGYIDGVQTLQDVYDTLIDPLIQDIEGGGVGIFKLATSSPGSDWTNTGHSMANRVVNPANYSGPVTTSYSIYKRTSETSPSVVRPVRTDSNTGFKEMSDAEITNYTLPLLYNRINEGNRLVYTFGADSSGIDAGSYIETHYDSSTNASEAQLVSGHTYYRAVSGLSSNVHYLRLLNT